MSAKPLNFLQLKLLECQPSLNIVIQTSHNMPDLNLLDVRGMTDNAMLSKLDEAFPQVNPNPEDTMEKIMYRSGQRSVVEWVIQYMDEN